MNFDPKVSPNRLHALAMARAEVKRLERIVSDEAIASVALTRGDILRDQDTGARYRVERASAAVTLNGAVQLYIEGTRVYSTGRRDARTSSHLYAGRMERVDTPAATS